MTSTPPDPHAWLQKARHDLEMTRRAMSPADPLPDMACFHAQQCAEKSLKAFLVSRNAPFRLVHDLTYLTQLCISVDPTFAQWLPAADILGEYAARVRYPLDKSREPGIKEAEHAIQLAESLLTFIESRIAAN